MISTTHLLHIASAAWCVEGTVSLKVQCSTGNRDAKRDCASVLSTSKVAQTPSYAASISVLDRCILYYIPMKYKLIFKSFIIKYILSICHENTFQIYLVKLY